MRLSLFFLVLFFICGVSAQTSLVNLHWCSGASQFNHVSDIRWSAFQAHQSVLSFQVCSSQKQALAAVSLARITVEGVDHTFPLCSSRMNCLEQSRQRRSNGNFCIVGETMFDFPVFPSLHHSVFVNLRILHGTTSSTGHADEIASFCSHY